MERKESAHGLQLVKFAAIKLKGYFSAIFMGTFAMVTPLVLCIVVPIIMSLLTGYGWIISIGIGLFAILVGPLQVGYIKFFNATLEGKQPRTSMVYSQLRFSVFTLRTVYIALILLIMYIIGGMLWIITAGFAVSFFSMVLFFLEKYEYPRLSMAMKDCAKRMVTNRLAMFSYKLIFYFVYFLLFCIAGLMLALVSVLTIDSLLISWLIAVCSTIVFIFLYTMVTVYFHSSNQVFFEDVLIREDKKKQRAKVKEKTEEEQKQVEDSKDKKDTKLVVSEEKVNNDDKKEKNTRKKKATTKSITKKNK